MEQIKKVLAIVVIIALILNIVGLIVLRYSTWIFWSVIAVAFMISYLFYRKKK